MKRAAKMTKHQAYRRNVKARALDMLGGKCQQCGCADERALRFCYTKPLRRTANGMRKRDKTSTQTHLAVIHGKKGVQLLCANCSVIKASKDWKANVNVKRATTQAGGVTQQ